MSDITAGGLRFALPKPAAAARAAECSGETPKPHVKPRVKHDPKLIAAARELRDRWLEQVNAPGGPTARDFLRRGRGNTT